MFFATLHPENIHLESGYHKIASSNTSRLEAHVDFFRMIKKEIFGP